MFLLRSAALATVALVGLVAPAHADLVPVVRRYAPSFVTFESVSGFEDTMLVVLGCHTSDGAHQTAIVDAKPGRGEPLECLFKPPPAPIVYAVLARDLKPLTDLLGQNVGALVEGGRAKGILDKAGRACGPLDEDSLLNGKGYGPIASFTARYAVEKTASGCSVKKIGETVAHSPPPLASAPSGTIAASPSASAPAAAPATSPSKSGCGSCAAIGGSGARESCSTLVCAASLLALLLARARHRRS